MDKLVRGIVEYRGRLTADERARWTQLARNQTPDTLFIACSDSRVVPNLVVSTRPGELFVVRSVGNLVAVADGEVSVGDLSEPAAIEYALSALQVKHIVVCGHSECGAMKALYAGGHIPGMPNLERWLENGREAVRRYHSESTHPAGMTPYDRISQLNVLLQLENIRTYPIVREALASGQVDLYAWWFDIETADVSSYDPDEQRFRVIEGEYAEELIRRLRPPGGSVPPPPPTHVKTL